MGSLSPWHWAVIAIVGILMIGYKRLPDAARSLGKSLRIFKAEVRELQSENKPETSVAPPAAAQPVQSERVEPPASDGRSA